MQILQEQISVHAVVTQFINWSKIMLKKELTESLLTLMPIVAFVILALYLLIQDASSVGPL
ncbi:hypothetical protein Mettu_3385 [Methylobacter tundripaludum SV96]|uniref:Uncharacterized protein n=2 Tax=Methylobacter tundripaludum TaxID=173365 RepID=G3IZ82_METTV|nr:hypothetical protein Mettu_3385 [Methylobacter tundripaludum SV96]